MFLLNTRTSLCSPKCSLYSHRIHLLIQLWYCFHFEIIISNFPLRWWVTINSFSLSLRLPCCVSGVSVYLCICLSTWWFLFWWICCFFCFKCFNFLFCLLFSLLFLFKWWLSPSFSCFYSGYSSSIAFGTSSLKQIGKLPTLLLYSACQAVQLFPETLKQLSCCLRKLFLTCNCHQMICWVWVSCSMG